LSLLLEALILSLDFDEWGINIIYLLVKNYPCGWSIYFPSYWIGFAFEAIFPVIEFGCSFLSFALTVSRLSIGIWVMGSHRVSSLIFWDLRKGVLFVGLWLWPLARVSRGFIGERFSFFVQRFDVTSLFMSLVIKWWEIRICWHLSVWFLVALLTVTGYFLQGIHFRLIYSHGGSEIGIVDGCGVVLWIDW
jgi:hypothetical protein